MAGLFDLTGKRVLVTGAGQGIGRACAQALSGAGGQVLASDLNGAALAGLDGCRTLTLDVTDPQAVAELASGEEFDVLVNCVGWVHGGTILDCGDDDLAASFDINVMSMFRLTRAILPGHAARRRRIDHQYCIGCGFGSGRAQSFCLWYDKSGGGRIDQGDCRRFRNAGNSLQCNLSRHGDDSHR